MVTNYYKSYLKSSAWQKKRETVFNKYGKRCYACGTYKGPIQVHHLTYARLGRESLSDLRPLCAICHRQVTTLHYKMGKRTSGTIVFNAFLKMKKAQRATKTKR